jgi:phenylpropionate dioxygenase-like ring-hydroxylating dioxygenase large terminal subunit
MTREPGQGRPSLGATGLPKDWATAAESCSAGHGAAWKGPEIGASTAGTAFARAFPDCARRCEETEVTTSSIVDAILSRLPDPDDHPDGAPMLPRECYTSPEFFEFERETVFARAWTCVGHDTQIPQTGDFIAATVAGEPLLIVRTAGRIHAMSAVCQHRGNVVVRESGRAGRLFRCPLHYWTYDHEGRLFSAPRMGDAEIACLRGTMRLPPVRVELWHGFIFVNLDDGAPALTPSLVKLDALWAGYDGVDLVAVPPTLADTALPWNWKVHVENFTDAYHPEFVHRGTHDFAPSVLGDDGVAFTDMRPGDNAIVRSVPLLRPDGSMMDEGWGVPPAFPPIAGLPAAQRTRLTFAMVPPSLTMMFTPTHIGYTLLVPAGAEATYASSDRQTGGGWLLPRSTVELDDFAARSKAVTTGAAKIWAQDVPVNLAMQAGRKSRFMPTTDRYGPLETTLVQFNAWLLRMYHGGGGTAAATRPRLVGAGD